VEGKKKGRSREGKGGKRMKKEVEEERKGKGGKSCAPSFLKFLDPPMLRPR